MVLKSDQQRIRDLLKEAIPMMCKNGLAFQSEFAIEALIGITLDRDDVFLVSIKETFQNDPPSQSSSSQITWQAVDREHHGELSGEDSADGSSSRSDMDRQSSRRHEMKPKSRATHLLTDANLQLEGVSTQSPRINTSGRESELKQGKRPVMPSPSQSLSGSHSGRARAKRRRSSESPREPKCEDVVVVKDEPLSDAEVSAIESTIRDSQLALGDELPFHVSSLSETTATVTEPTSSRLEAPHVPLSESSHSAASPLDYQMPSDSDVSASAHVWPPSDQPQPSTSQGKPPDFTASSSADVPVSQIGFLHEGVEGTEKKSAPVSSALQHYSERLPPTPKKQRPKRRCRLCYRQGKRRETMYYCKTCPDHPALCLPECFVKYHELLRQSFWPT